MSRTRIFIGIIYVLVSFSTFLFPDIHTSKLFLASLFYTGVIYICETITVSLAGTSLLREVRRSAKNFASFLVASTIGGVLLDGVAKFLGKLWVYPDWSSSYYVFIFIPGFAAYWVVITESYLASKAVMDYVRKGRTIIHRSYAYEPFLYRGLGVLGICLIIISAVSIMNDFGQQSLPFLRSNSVGVFGDVFAVTFKDVVLLCFGVWLVLEFLEFYRKKTSLIRDVIHGYYTPFVAIVLGAFILSVLMEAQNIPVGLWRYTNWPLGDYLLLGIPALVWLAWPLHYIVFLSLFRVLTGKESDQVWRGDVIK